MKKKSDVTDYQDNETYNNNKSTTGLQFSRNVPNYLSLDSGMFDLLKPNEKIRYLKQIEDIREYYLKNNVE